MKKNYLLLISLFLVAMSASAQVTVCGTYLEESGQVNSPYITSGTVTWDATSHTLTLDNASIEYTSNNPQDGIRPIRVTNDATIVVQGDCKLTTTGHVAIALDSYNSKNVTIKGNGTLSTSSSWIDIFLVVAHLTIQDITLNVDMGIANNAEGNGVGLAFNNVQATIKDGVARIGDGITFTNCAITYPEGAYVEQADYGYTIYYGNHQSPDKIIISRTGSNVKGDVNGDGEVNIADVNAVINVILGGESNPRADVNNDTEVNIADVNAVINIILNPEPADNHEWVDLGLPSGTLWATMNVGANAPEQYGDYFAWGETEPKDIYKWTTYKWCNGTNNTLTKYCTDSSCGYNGFVDNKTELEPSDDAACAHFPDGCMPSVEQIQELCDCCTWQWTEMNGVNGQLVTGPNGATMFLPAAGHRYDDKLQNVGSSCYYWSRTIFPNYPYYYAYRLYFTSEQVDWGIISRMYGFPVRAVRVQ
jgi:hypothetical protein